MQIACAVAGSVPRFSGSAMSETRTDTYGYNACSELISAAKSGGSASVSAVTECAYQYDDIGNRLTSLDLGTNRTYTANNLNQYTSITDVAAAPSPSQNETFTPQFDDDGNQTLIQTSTGIWQVQYNGENRPILWTCTQSNNSNNTNNQTISMSYDRMGRRVIKNNQRFVYDGYLQIANFELSATNSQLFIWDPTEPVSTRTLVWLRCTAVAFYNHDGNKNVSDITSMSRVLIEHYDISPLGSTLGALKPANSWRVSSEFSDSDTDTIYYNYRHYSPMLGRWLCRDLHDSKQLSPIDFDSLESTYVFVSNRMTDTIDLLGLKDKFRDCTPPKIWKTRSDGAEVPPADGCSVPKWAEKLLPGSKDNPTGFSSFLEACNYHDICYSNCNKDKDTCDNEFYTKMLVACLNSVLTIKDRKKREKMHKGCRKWAEIYYEAVSTGGTSSYKNRQNLNCECACP